MISQIVFADITILSCIQYLLCILSPAELGKFSLQSPVLLLLLLPHNPGSSYCLTLEYKYTASVPKRCKFVRASVYGQASPYWPRTDWDRLVGKFYFDSELEFPKKN